MRRTFSAPAKLRRVGVMLVVIAVALLGPTGPRHVAADTLPVTGTFYANDNGVYYMQQSGSSLWWLGESVDKDSNPNGGFLGPNHVWNRGLASTSVFQGTISGSTATGSWVEVSRGSSMQTGTSTLAIDTVTDTLGTHAHLTLTGGTAPNGASDWLQGDQINDRFFQYPDGHAEIVDFYNRFQNAKKSVQASNNSEGDKLGDTHNPEQLRPYRDQTVFYGFLETLGLNPDGVDYEAPHVNVPAPGNPGAFAWTYHNFACYANDGDFDLRVRADDTSLTTDFLSNAGWGNSNAADEGESTSPGSDYHDILPKLQGVGPFTGGGFHLGVEGIMYGGDNVNNCPTSAASVLPGWADSGGNSILVNGQPIDAYNHPEHLMVSPNPIRPTGNALPLAGINGYPIVAQDPANGVNTGTEVRVTGAMILDCGHSDLDDDELYFTPTDALHTCDQGEAYEDTDDQNQELHTFYSLDLIECPLGYAPDYCPSNNNTARANLTGAWGSNDGGTYYIRQIGNDIWWAGLTRNRDPIMPDDATRVPTPIPNPTNVFHGTITHNADGSATITGGAMTLPKSENATGGDATTATFTVNPNRKAMDLASSSSSTFPWPVHFDKLYEPPDTTPPVSALSIGAPQLTGGGQTFVTSATPLTLSATDSSSGVQNLWYRSYPAGSAAPAFTPANGASATLNVTGADGVYTIDTYATDNAGNDEAVHTTSVYLDNTAPAITITAPAGTNYTHSSTITLAYGATDGAGSGVASTTATIDGSPTLLNGQTLVNGLPVDLLTQLSLGFHTFTVNSTDQVGNESSSFVIFNVIVTATSIEDDVQQFFASGAIANKKLFNWLLSTLAAAAKARAAGNCHTAANDYNAFISKVQVSTPKYVTPTASAILIADAKYLIAHCP